MGRRLAKRDVKPDLLLSSPALRALTTAHLIAEEVGYKRKAIVVDDLLYASSADDLLAMLDASGLTGFHATTSGAPFLEVQGAGVTKASGVARLCAILGFEAADVMAAGDARNDVELIEWAGFGVAMGNAVPEAIAAADWTTTHNEDDGLALAIEQVLAAIAVDD